MRLQFGGMEFLEELGGYEGQLKTSLLRSDRHSISRYIFSFHCDYKLHALVSVFGCEGKAPLQLGGEGPSPLPAFGREKECVFSVMHVSARSHIRYGLVSGQISFLI